MQEMKDFIDEVLAKFDEEITDAVFLFIQNDHNMMREYLKFVEAKGLQPLNAAIGRAISLRYKPKNLSHPQERPRSTLIQSFHPFE